MSCKDLAQRRSKESEMCQSLVKEKLTLNTNQTQLCASPPTLHFIGELSLSAWACPYCFRDNQHLSQSVDKNESWGGWKQQEKNMQLTFCSAARIPAGRWVQFSLLEGLLRVKDLIFKFEALRDEFQYTPTQHISVSSAGTFAALWQPPSCLAQLQAGGCSRDTRFISVVPVLVIDAAAKQSCPLAGQLTHAACWQALCTGTHLGQRPYGVTQGLTGKLSLVSRGRWYAYTVFSFPS